MMDRAGSVIKISRPLQELSLARTAQDLSCGIRARHRRQLFEPVFSLQPKRHRNQFDQYSDQIAAEIGIYSSQFGQQSDPLGFGYKVPNRVREYIGQLRPAT